MLITADMMPGVNKMMLITEIYELKRVCECVPGCNAFSFWNELSEDDIVHSLHNVESGSFPMLPCRKNYKSPLILIHVLYNTSTTPQPLCVLLRQFILYLFNFS